jgi:predicted DNA-binding protein
MGHLKELAKENMEICKKLHGRDRSEFIEEHLEDYYFAMNVVTAPKVLRYYRELFVELVKNFGH